MKNLRFSKIYKLEKSSNASDFGYYHNTELEKDSINYIIISQSVFEYDGQLFILCLLEHLDKVDE